MHTIASAISHLIKENVTSSRSDVLELVSFYTGVTYEELSTRMNDEVDLETPEFKNILQKLSESYPLAYIIGKRHFCGNYFFVDENVLIPRYETEFLVQAAVEKAAVEKPRVLDICTGSGCILLSILDIVQGSTGIGLDISKGALGVAKKNAQNLGLDGSASFIQADALNLEGLFKEKFDIITCNPPYVSDIEYDSLEKSVLYEPRTALTAGMEGLEFYKKLMDIACDMCNKNGTVLFEIGAGQADFVRLFAGDRKFEFITDFQGIERVALWTNL